MTGNIVGMTGNIAGVLAQHRRGFGARHRRGFGASSSGFWRVIVGVMTGANHRIVRGVRADGMLNIRGRAP
jgi:hypothetical protein